MKQVTKSELNQLAVGGKSALAIIQRAIKEDNYAEALEYWAYLNHMVTGLKLGIDARRVQKGA
jgi:hypothetical protein